MTASEYQQDYAKKGKKPAATARTPPARHNPAPSQLAPRADDVLPPAHFTHDNGARAWLVGPQAFSLAAPFSPGRHRIVLTGPADAGLLRVLLEAATEYLARPAAPAGPSG